MVSFTLPQKFLFAVFLTAAGALFFSASFASAASFVVDSTSDMADSNPGDGICSDLSTDCTLRAAIGESNALAGADTITFGITGTITPGYGFPDLVDTSGVTITGPGSTNLTIDASNVSDLGVFRITGSDHNDISGFTVNNISQSGFYVEDANDNTFDDLVLIGRGTDTGASLLEFVNSDYNTVTDSAFSEGGLGLRFKAHADHNSVSNSSSIDNQHSGMTIYDSSYNTVSDNHIEASDNFGMYVIFGADHNTISGNTIIDNLQEGIMVDQEGDDNGLTADNIFTDNTITGNQWGGVTVGEFAENNTFSGNIISGNAYRGLHIHDTSGVIAEGNTFKDNGQSGIAVTESSDITIIGNYVGTDSNGVGFNGDAAISLDHATNVIIGGAGSERNYLVGENTMGIAIMGSSAVAVSGNYVGIDQAGASAGAFEIGVMVDEGSSDVSIGGSSAGMGNVIAGSLMAGVINMTSGTVIQGNKIGTNASGQIESGYGNDLGIIVGSETGNHTTIGGTGAGEGNIIAGNATAGIVFVGFGQVYAQDNAILGNSIFGNNGNGIDLVEDFENPVFGHTVNDSGDADSGPNGYLNHPELVQVNATTDTVTYDLDVPEGYYRVEFFKNPTLGLSGDGYGEGEVFAGASAVITSTGSVLSGQIHVITGGIDAADVVTATVTQCTNDTCSAFLATSEFSGSAVTIED